MEEVLVGDEIWIRISIAAGNICGELTFVSELKGIVQRLGDVREVGTKRKFCDDVRQIHHCRTGQQTAMPNIGMRLTVVVNMLVTGVTMPKSCDVQVR